MTLETLLKQKDELEVQIERMRREERSKAVEQVKALMQTHGLTLGDIAVKARASGKRKSGAVAPKYLDRVTGSTWSGRGLRPNWLKQALAAGRSLDEFAL